MDKLTWVPHCQRLSYAVTVFGRWIDLKQQNPREEAVAPLRKNFSSPVRSLLTLETRNVAKELELYFKR